jgi:nitrogenase molybdenum-iron protein NifN
VHGAQGCSAFAKVFFIQHFHDPIPLQSTAMDPTSTVMGADGNILTALNAVPAQQPESHRPAEHGSV